MGFVCSISHNFRSSIKKKSEQKKDMICFIFFFLICMTKWMTEKQGKNMLSGWGVVKNKDRLFSFFLTRELTSTITVGTTSGIRMVRGLFLAHDIRLLVRSVALD